MRANEILIGVCGAHMSGLPLNYQLLDLDAKYIKTIKTIKGYRMFELTKKEPFRPGMFFDANSKFDIMLEIWTMPVHNFGKLVKLVASPLGIGTIFLEDGNSVHGFLCEPYYTQGEKEISNYGSWREYQNQ